MSVRQILETFDKWRADGRSMVLATVYETLGSTYSKAGQRILIGADGRYQGLVSGGCLEGDLAERARTVLETNRAAAVTYDMRGEADELFGLGVGCEGLIRVLLQPLLAVRGYQPFASIAQHQLASRPAVVATVIEEGARPGMTVGATMIVAGSREAWDLDDAAQDVLGKACERALRTGETRYSRDESGLGVLYAILKPVPRLLLLGAGLDAVPLVNMGADLGWRVTVVDHRPAYLERGGFERAECVIHVVPRLLAETVPLADFDAIIVMSHHLTTDRTYLGQLADVDTRYLGVLGPRARKERLLAGLRETGQALRSRLKGPVGLNIGADSPESIALSVLAELQATLSGATAEPLSK
jgi:xanthine dehydrogenase accessory factor